MASHNQGSRTFLAVVLGGIVIAFVIAAYIMAGDHGETTSEMHEPAAEHPAATAADEPMEADAPAEEMPTENVTPPDEMSDEEMMIEESPDDSMRP